MAQCFSWCISCCEACPCCKPKAQVYPGGRPYSSLELDEVHPRAVSNQLQTLSHNLTRDSLPLVNPSLELRDFSEVVSPLDEQERQRLVDFWTEQGRGEHASIASFALFSQKLLAVGAPSSLISEALVCAQEEMEHARLAFGLASAFSGETLTAGTYDTHTFQVSADFSTLLQGTIKEGCVSETLGALLAAKKAQSEEDPVVKGVWSKIAIDEAFHASYAWRVVLWGLSQDPKEAEEVLRDTISKELSVFNTGGLLYAEEKEIIQKMADAILEPYPSVLSVPKYQNYGADYVNVIRVLASTVRMSSM